MNAAGVVSWKTKAEFYQKIQQQQKKEEALAPLVRARVFQSRPPRRQFSIIL